MPSGRKVVIQNGSAKYFAANGTELNKKYFEKQEGKIDIKASGRYSITKSGKTRYFAANGVELKENYFKKVENPDVIVKTNNKSYNLNKSIEKRINKVTSDLERAEKQNGIIGKAWSWLKNTGGFGDSSDKVREQQKKEKQLLAQFNSNPQRRAIIFKQLTGADYTPENLEKFINGQIMLCSECALRGYKEGQEMAVDVTADIVSGVVSFGVYTAAVAAAPFTGGASIAVGVAAAAGTGALVKTGVKYADAKSGGRKYTLKDAGHDAATGAFSGVLAPATAGAGGAVGKVVTVQAGKAGLKAGVTKAIAFTAEMATDGVLGGGADNAFRTAIDGGSAEEILDAGITGAEYGVVLGPLMGWGGKGLGKTYKVTKGVLKKADDVVPKQPAKLKATPEYELDEFGQVHLKNGAEPVKTEVEVIGHLEDGQSIIKGADDNALAAKKKAMKAQLLAKRQASSQVTSDIVEAVPKGHVRDAKTGKPVKVDMSKVRTKIDKTGSASNNEIGLVTIYDELGNELGIVQYSLNKNVLKFEGLHSNVEGCGLGTRLISELKNIAKNNGCNKLIATASPSTGAGNRPITNMSFYYKLGFKASNINLHNQILDCIKNNKPIPLKLNLLVDIELNN